MIKEINWRTVNNVYDLNKDDDVYIEKLANHLGMFKDRMIEKINEYKEEQENDN